MARRRSAKTQRISMSRLAAGRTATGVPLKFRQPKGPSTTPISTTAQALLKGQSIPRG